MTYADQQAPPIETEVDEIEVITLANGDLSIGSNNRQHDNLIAMLCFGVGVQDKPTNGWIVFSMFAHSTLMSLERYREKGYKITVWNFPRSGLK
jgi:hypothetical protein